MRYSHSQLFTPADEAIDGCVVDACFTGLFRTVCLSKETFKFVIIITKESVRICRCFAVMKYTGSGRKSNIFLTYSTISRLNGRISCKCLCYQCSDPQYCWGVSIQIDWQGIYFCDLSFLWYNTMPAKDNRNFLSFNRIIITIIIIIIIIIVIFYIIVYLINIVFFY